jgi:anti-sigma factor RsiW
MKCKRVLGLVSDYLGGQLTESTKQDFELHIDCCPACASEVKATSGLLASLSSLSGKRSPVDCWNGVRTCILVERREMTPWWRSVMRPVVAAPAAVAMAVLALFLLWPSPQASVASSGEYSNYIEAHSVLQRQQALADPDVVFVVAELEKASLMPSVE